MNTANSTPLDQWSGLANMLANLIAKYADVLETEENKTEEKEDQTAPLQNRESPSGGSFCLPITLNYDIIDV
ncbi:MAG: hypothetical protein IKN04_00660 [Clostridia bacterium]|nr:hypothetical protein [Clostridia bacterium]